MSIMQDVYKNKYGEILDIKLIKNQYLNYVPRKTIAKFSNCSWQQIDKIIRNFNWDRPFKSKYSIDECFFENIDTESKAYFLGLALADGYISKTHKVFKISLQEKDRNILETFKLEIRSNSPLKFTKVKKRNHSNYYTFTIYSEKVCKDLIKLECVNNKSQNLIWNIRRIPKKLLNHFIRGYFDGDGCFSYRFHNKKYLKAVVNFTSTENFCIGLKNFIYENFKYNVYISRRYPKGPSRTISLSGNKQILNFINWMYENSTIFLERKRKKIEEFLHFYLNE